MDDGNDSRLLVPDPAVAQRYGVSLMTLWRWTRDKELEFPQPVKIRERNYRNAVDLDAFDRRQVRLSLEARKRKLQPHRPAA